jgi:hypothetical protein
MNESWRGRGGFLGRGSDGKEKDFLLGLSCLAITATGFPGCVWRTIDLYFILFRFMDELRMDYYFTIY